MFLARSHLEINNLRSGIERIGRLSDNIVRIGPFGIGLDGVLAWVPIVGDVYSVGAGLLLLLCGVRARAPLSTLGAVVLLITLRSGVDLAPVIGPAMVDLFRGHKMAADMLVKAIDNTAYVEGRRNSANPNYADVHERVRVGAEKRRVVFLS